MVDAGFMSNQSNSKDMRMLQAGIDSMKVQNDSVGRSYYKEAMASTYKATTNTLSKTDTMKIESARLGNYDVDSLFNAATLMQKQKIMSTAVSRAESAASDWSFKGFNISQTETSLRRHMTSWHEKLTLSLACLIFFFIGAPLGGIIVKAVWVCLWWCPCLFSSSITSSIIRAIRWRVTVNGLYGWACGPVRLC